MRLHYDLAIEKALNLYEVFIIGNPADRSFGLIDCNEQQAQAQPSSQQEHLGAPHRVSLHSMKICCALVYLAGVLHLHAMEEGRQKMHAAFT